MNKKVEFEIIEKSTHSGKIPQLYSQLAWVYDFFTDYEVAHHREAIQIAGIKENDVVLEVACGTGRATVEIAKLIGRKGKFYAIDITRAMLERTENKLRKNNLLDKVDLKIADAKTLPFTDGKFDIVYNAYMFDLIDINDFSNILCEFKRVLKPGGKLVLVNMSKNTKDKTLYESLYEKKLLRFASGGCRPVFMKPFLEEAGFEKIERIYRKNRGWFFLNWLTGTEIILGHKPDLKDM